MTADPANRQRQRDLYGEPLADISARLMPALGLNQGGLAKVLGLSAPMLSQLLSGQRVKIGNPAVVHRLQALAELADEAGALAPAELARRLDAIRDEHPTVLTRTDSSRHAELVSGLRAAAPAQELRRAAHALSAAGIPTLATLLEEAARPAGDGGG